MTNINGANAHTSASSCKRMLSDKVHATTPKVLVGCFEFTVFQRNFERIVGEAMDMCL